MTKDAFVVMPFSATESCSEDDWTDTFNYVFKPAFEEAGYSCDRAEAVTGGLVDSIVE